MKSNSGLIVLALLAILGVGVLLSPSGSSGLPQPGDSVSPRLANDIQWEAGKPGALYVDLAATNTWGKARRLGFNASPRINPVASVDFFSRGGELIQSTQVELSQRC